MTPSAIPFNPSNLLWIRRYNSNHKVCWDEREMISFLLATTSMNIACKLDQAWYDPGPIAPPFDEFEIPDFMGYMAEHGQLLREQPLTWAFGSYQDFFDLLGIFTESQMYLVAQVATDDIESEANLEDFGFWYQRSTCLFAPSPDDTGLYLISKDGRLLAKLKHEICHRFQLTENEVDFLDDSGFALAQEYLH